MESETGREREKASDEDGKKSMSMPSQCTNLNALVCKRVFGEKQERKRERERGKRAY